MGNWAIVIHGTGVHHNTRTEEVPQTDALPAHKVVSVLESDANVMAAEFVKLLKEKGHTVTAAHFTAGGTEGLGDPEAYLKNYKPEGATVR